MAAVVKEIDSHGQPIAQSWWWKDGGRYDDHGTAWGTRLELHRDGTVYMQKILYHREQGPATLRRRKWETLDAMRRDYAAWQDFRDAWIQMQKNLERQAAPVGSGRARKPAAAVH